MERFNLDTWIKDKSRKVIDDDGFPVEIIKWDANEKYPVVLLNHNGIAYNVSVDGMYDSDPNHGIFFADNELTEFEEMLASTISAWQISMKDSFGEGNYQLLKKDAKELLDLAREEFIPKKQYDEDLEQAYKNADKVQFNRGMDEVLTNPQKYFHVGDTIRLKNSNAEHTITSIFNGRYYGERWSLDIMKAADDYELVKRCDQKFNIGDTVCRKYYEDHTIVRIYYTCNDPVYVCKNEEGLESHIKFSDQDEWELKSESKNNNIDYSSEVIGFLKNYIKAYGCTAMNSWVKWLEEQCHDGKKWIYEDTYIKDKEQTFQDGIDEVLENPQKYGLERKGEQKSAENQGKSSDNIVEEKDMAEYKKGFECGKQRVLKYPEDFNLCKKPS